MYIIEYRPVENMDHFSYCNCLQNQYPSGKGKNYSVIR